MASSGVFIVNFEHISHIVQAHLEQANAGWVLTFQYMPFPILLVPRLHDITSHLYRVFFTISQSCSIVQNNQFI